MAARKGKVPVRKRITGADGKVHVYGRGVNGDGSVYFVEAENTWRASYVVAGDLKPDGRPRVRYVRGRTREVAEQRRADAIARVAAELEAAGKVSRFTRETTVAELVAWWLQNVARHRLRPSSLGAIAGRVTPERLGALAEVPVVALTQEEVTSWQSELLSGADALSPSTVSDSRTTLRQVIESAVAHGLVPVNVVTPVKSPKVEHRPGRALEPAEARQLVEACVGSRYGAAVALLFVQGWRVSEVLGLAWSDLDLEEGTAHVRRAVIDVKGQGRTLGPPKTKGVEGVHQLAPGVVEKLKRRRVEQLEERLAAGPLWVEHSYEGKRIELVFTQGGGGLGARQHVDKLIRRKAEELGIDATKLGTHAGRRTVVTSLYLAGEDIEDIARHVGHRSTSTTAGYVASLGNRPKRTAATAAGLLDSSG